MQRFANIIVGISVCEAEPPLTHAHRARMSGKCEITLSVRNGETIGGVYLCQVNEHVSCGACCGLYNVDGLSQQFLEGMLRQRTEQFARVLRTADAIEEFGVKMEGWSPRKRPYPDFYHCPFLGLIGENSGRVGCLLHPAAKGNDGKDWRGISYYGGMACRTYFCPTARQLPASYLRVLRQSMDHWYPYGLIVTERQLISAFFREVEGRLGHPLQAADVATASNVAAVLRKFADLKIAWPYRRKEVPGPCNYFFENGAYSRSPVMRQRGDIPPSRYEDIFRELESGFSSKEDLHRAEALLQDLFDSLKPAFESDGVHAPALKEF